MSIKMVADLLLIAVSLGGVYALMASGLTLVYGVTRVFNFAQGSFFLWGSYIAWVLHEGYFHLDYPLAFVLTIGIMFFFGLLYEKVIIYPLRRFADWTWTAIIVTLGSALFLDNLAQVIFGVQGRTLPYLVEGTFTLGAFTIARHNVAVLVIVVVIMIILNLFLGKTKAGMAMRGVAQDTTGAQIVGIPIDRVFGYTFAITAVLGGISGMLLAPRTQIFPYVGWPVLVKALVVVVFGGLGSIKGTLIAAFSLAVVEVFITYYLGGIWALPVFLVVLVVMLTIKPRGLFGVW